MPRISYPVNDLIVHYGRVEDVEVIVDPNDDSLVVKIDRKPVLRVDHAYHLKITGVE